MIIQFYLQCPQMTMNKISTSNGLWCIWTYTRLLNRYLYGMRVPWKSAYPEKLKLADVSPLYKKENPLLLKSYRPVSVLPTVTKTFERLMQSQLNEHVNRFLSSFLCSYITGFSTQTTSLLFRFSLMLDNKGYASAVLMDPFKAFITINYELLTAKLHVLMYMDLARRLSN